jgi:hypothetical protein
MAMRHPAHYPRKPRKSLYRKSKFVLREDHESLSHALSIVGATAREAREMAGKALNGIERLLIERQKTREVSELGLNEKLLAENQALLATIAALRKVLIENGLQK